VAKVLNKYGEAYIKCIKIFYGYDRRHSVIADFQPIFARSASAVTL